MNVYVVSHIVFTLQDLEEDNFFPVNRQFVTASPAQAAGIAAIFCQPCNEDEMSSKIEYIKTEVDPEELDKIVSKMVCSDCNEHHEHIGLEDLQDEAVDKLYRFVRKHQTEGILEHLLSGEDEDEWGFLEGHYYDGFGWWVLIERLPMLDGPADVGYGTNATINIDGSGVAVVNG